MKIVLLLFLLLFLAGVSAGGYLLFKQVTTPKVVFYQTAKVDVGEIAIVATATGNVEPTSSVKVGSQVSGRVKEVRVEQDQRVKAGEIIAVIDTELMENDLHDKEIALEQSRSNLKLLEIEITQLDLKEERLKQSIERERITSERTKASCELAQRTFARFTEMVRKSAAAESELDIRRLEKDNAERDVELRKIESAALEADLKEIQISRKSLAAKTIQSQLAIDQADQALQRARTNLKYANLVSPIDGVVMERLVETGQTIAAQFQTPDLFKIAADLKRIRITANIDEIDVGKIKNGQKVSFEVDAYRGEKFSGVVKTVHFKHETKANLVSYPVVIEAENPPVPDHPMGKLLPGMTAFLEFDVQHKTSVTRIPAAALRFTPPPPSAFQTVSPPAKPAASVSEKKDDEKKKEPEKPLGTPATVHIKDKLGKPTPVQIRIGDSNGQFYELLSGPLKPGDEVITGTTDQDPAASLSVTLDDQ